MKLVVATGNAGKLKEIKEILKDQPFEVVSMKEMGIDVEVEETGVTFAENAYLKAKAIYDICGEYTMADDSGLVVDALNGEPGVYSARYAGQGHDDKANNAKLLANMKGKTNRKAHFVSSICMVSPAGSFVVEGKCDGEIGEGEKGQGGFGYDPLFVVPEFLKTFGELTDKEKNSISHRGKALILFEEEIKKYIK